jgi:hypothetical protein
MAVCSEIHTKHINTVCGENVELLNVKPDGTFSNHLALQLKSQCTVMEHLIFVCENEGTNDRRMDSNGSVVHWTSRHTSIFSPRKAERRTIKRHHICVHNTVIMTTKHSCLL